MAGLGQVNVDAILAEAIARLRVALSPSAIYLYGSRANGTAGAQSDLDLLAIVPRSDLGAFERDAVAYRALGDLPFPIDVQVYTQAEFEARSALAVSFERTVKSTGKLVHAA